MLFSQVIGQSSIKSQIQRMLKEERIPHALLFAGPEGSGKLPMALAQLHPIKSDEPHKLFGLPCSPIFSYTPNFSLYIEAFTPSFIICSVLLPSIGRIPYVFILSPLRVSSKVPFLIRFSTRSYNSQATDCGTTTFFCHWERNTTRYKERTH